MEEGEGSNKKPRTTNSYDDSYIYYEHGDDDDVKLENMLNNFTNKNNTFTRTNVPNPILPMVIKLQINNFSVLRVSVSTGSQANILYWSAFLRMRFSESMLKPCEQAFLEDVIGNGVPVKGYIDLDTIFGKGENAKMIRVRYLVVDSNSVYNVVIGMPALSDLHAIFSAGELRLLYPVGDGKYGVVEADREMAMKCHEMCPCSV